MSRFHKTISELADNYDYIRVPLSAKQRENLAKIYPYYGAQNVIDHVDEYLFDGEYLLVAEDGANLISQNERVCNIVSGKFWVNNHAHIIKGKNGNLTKYLYYYLNILDFKPFVTGSAQPKLTQENLDSIVIYAHEPYEQMRIVSMLDSIDSKIELNNKINAELEALAKTIYDYWFVQFDFPISADLAASMGKPELEGQPYKSSGGKMVWSEELKREVPEGWEVEKLGDLTRKYTDVSKKIPSNEIMNSGSYPVITQDNGALISGYTNEEHPIIDSPIIVFGDHSCTLRFINFPFFRGADGTQLLLFEENLALYCYQFLQSTIIKLPNYGKYERHFKYLKEFTLVVPPKNILTDFIEMVSPSIEKSKAILFENIKLAELRDWLLPMLMNGQIRVE